jgi:hypothetical protein
MEIYLTVNTYFDGTVNLQTHFDFLTQLLFLYDNF